MRADRSVTVTATAAEPYIAHHPQPLHQRIVYPPNNRLHVIHPHSNRLKYWGSLLSSDRKSNNNQYTHHDTKRFWGQTDCTPAHARTSTTLSHYHFRVFAWPASVAWYEGGMPCCGSCPVSGHLMHRNL
ncbi:hypothetical protein NXS19_005256 [Fusarium pseudograminearum]|nr:hypothetical protein FPSE5266_20210 [Fusarium pseudograminearum]UZP37440.1 hypothetical protein NXS19_005256 [Fusarium pseudograminearum]